MRLKVQQFAEQNARNAQSAEKEMSFLSDELQRSLQEEHTLEVRAKEGERRVSELQREVDDLRAKRDAALARRHAQAEENVRIQRRLSRGRDSRGETEERLHRCEAEAQQLRTRIANS